ncbi:MAG TPA: hypothetical protein VIY28_09235 [Pseudonocardiaceae bacterium]
MSPELIAACALTPQQCTRLDEQQTHLSEQLTHWNAVRQAQIRDGLTPNYTRADLAPGDLICYRRQWLPVVRSNPKSVTVPSIVGGDWTDTVRYERISDRARPGEARWPQLTRRGARSRPPLEPGTDAAPRLAAADQPVTSSVLLGHRASSRCCY